MIADAPPDRDMIKYLREAVDSFSELPRVKLDKNDGFGWKLDNME